MCVLRAHKQVRSGVAGLGKSGVDLWESAFVEAGNGAACLVSHPLGGDVDRLSSRPAKATW